MANTKKTEAQAEPAAEQKGEPNFKIDLDLKKQVLAILASSDFKRRVTDIFNDCMREYEKKKKPSGSGSAAPPPGGQFWSNVGLPRDAME